MLLVSGNGFEEIAWLVSIAINRCSIAQPQQLHGGRVGAGHSSRRDVTTAIAA